MHYRRLYIVSFSGCFDLCWCWTDHKPLYTVWPALYMQQHMDWCHKYSLGFQSVCICTFDRAICWNWMEPWWFQKGWKHQWNINGVLNVKDNDTIDPEKLILQYTWAGYLFFVFLVNIRDTLISRYKWLSVFDGEQISHMV